MSKFKVNVKLSGYEVKLGSVEFSVEGEREDAQKISHEIEKQLSGMIHAPTVMTPTLITPSNGNSNQRALEGQLGGDDDRVAGRTRKSRKAGGSSGSRTPTESINLSHDSATYGSPQQSWTTVQKAIWFLHVVNKQANVPQMTANNITKNFNKYFRAAGAVHRGNVTKYLEAERVKGQNATVGADMADGAAKYFLTQAGTAVAEKLCRGEVVAA
jgi:hypothetical protein